MFTSIKNLVLGLRKPEVFKPKLPLDLSDPLFLENPYLYYNFLRREDPCHKSASGGYLVCLSKDVKMLLASSSVGNCPSERSALHSKNKENYFSAELANNILPFQDGDEHRECRKALTLELYSYINKSPLDYSAIAHSLMDKLEQEKEIDILRDFASPFAVKSMMLLFGFPLEDEQKLTFWSNHFFYLFAAIQDERLFEKINIQLQVCRAYLLNAVKNSKQENGFLAYLAKTDSFSKIKPEIIADLALLLFADGIENVDKQIANTFFLLLKNPKQLRALKKNKNLLKGAVQEGLRLEAAAQFIPRVCKEQFVLHGKTINKNDTLFLMLGSANRDEDSFELPEKFLIERSDTAKHFSFGRGEHSCIGNRLAQEQIEAAISFLIYEFLEENILTLESYRWDCRWGHRWLNHLVYSRK